MNARNPHDARAAPFFSILLLAGIVLAGCGDAPTGVRPEVDDLLDPQTDDPIVAALFAEALDRVAQLMGDEFVRPLTVQAVGIVVADQLAVALEPGVEDRETSDGEIGDPIAALLNVRDLLGHETQSAEMDLQKSETADDTIDPDSLIVEDALTLVVDDALDELLAAADTSTGG